MDVLTRLRLLAGPVRPFVLGKLLFALKKRRAYTALHSIALQGTTYSPLAAAPSLRQELFPLPSQTWWDEHGGQLSTWLQSVGEHRIAVVDSVFGARRAGTEWKAAGVREETFDDMRARVATLDAGYAPIDWNAHPAAGVRWPELQWFARRQEHEHVEDASVAPDIRVPHELSRMHHWMSLALDKAYHRELRNQMIDLLAHNPPGYGLQWAFPMGVGMRCFCMLTALDWMRQTGTHDEALEKLVAASAVDHARFLMHTAEWAGGMRTSHYIGCLFGLLAAGVYVDTEESVHWLRMGLAELSVELQTQFGSDSVNFEASTGYHKHVIDFFVQATTLVTTAHSKHPHIVPALPAAWLLRLHAGVQALHTLERIGMPMIGDNDDGMAVKLLGYHAEKVFVHDAPASNPIGFVHDVAASNPLGVASSRIKHTAFTKFGLDVYERERYTLTARCGPVGQWGKGGHAHNDRNAITLRVGDTWLVVDSGCMTYTGDPVRRNSDRSTLAHATLCVEGREQLLWPNDHGEGLFWMMPDNTRARITQRDDQGWSAEHFGFGKPHTRTLEFADSTVRGTDTYERAAGEVVIVRFPLGPTITFSDDTFYSAGRPLATLAVEGVERVWTENTEYSGAYGSSQPNYTLCMLVKGQRVVWTIIVLD